MNFQSIFIVSIFSSIVRLYSEDSNTVTTPNAKYHYSASAVAIGSGGSFASSSGRSRTPVVPPGGTIHIGGHPSSWSKGIVEDGTDESGNPIWKAGWTISDTFPSNIDNLGYIIGLTGTPSRADGTFTKVASASARGETDSNPDAFGFFWLRIRNRLPGNPAPDNPSMLNNGWAEFGVFMWRDQLGKDQLTRDGYDFDQADSP